MSEVSTLRRLIETYLLDHGWSCSDGRGHWRHPDDDNRVRIFSEAVFVQIRLERTERHEDAEGTR